MKEINKNYYMNIKKILIITITYCSIVLVPAAFGNKEVLTMGSSSSEITLDDSVEQPIVLKKVKDYDKIKGLQKEYISQKYEGYRTKGKIITKNKDNKFIETLILLNHEGQYIAIAFDITDTCKSYKHSKNKEFVEKIETLLKLSNSKK